MKSLRPYQADLISNARNSLASGKFSPCVVAPCGAGKSVILADIAKLTTDKGNRVLFIVHRIELVEQITQTFREYGVNMNLCDIYMVQTAARRLDRIQKPSLILTDEGHHGNANSYKKVYEHFSDVYRIGVTATPTRLDGSGLREVYDDLILGPTVSDLIRMGHLAPYKYYGFPTVKTDDLKISKGEFVMTEEKTQNIWGDVISTYLDKANGMKTIVYCHSIVASKTMAERFNAEGIPAEHIDGTTTPAERKRIINDFRSGAIKILSNVDIVGEGFDVPDCEAVILLRPTLSLALHIQQSMRCMRFKPGKTAIILDHVGNFERHGLPDTPHEWSLDAKKKKNRREKSKAIKQCTECFAVYPATETACPYCGYVPEVKQKEYVEHKEVELTEIKQELVIDYRTVADCRCYKDLVQLAKNRGYKKPNGWAYIQAKRLGWIK